MHPPAHVSPAFTVPTLLSPPDVPLPALLPHFSPSLLPLFPPSPPSSLPLALPPLRVVTTALTKHVCRHFIAGWATDPAARPSIADVKESLVGMVSVRSIWCLHTARIRLNTVLHSMRFIEPGFRHVVLASSIFITALMPSATFQTPPPVVMATTSLHASIHSLS